MKRRNKTFPTRITAQRRTMTMKAMRRKMVRGTVRCMSYQTCLDVTVFWSLTLYQICRREDSGAHDEKRMHLGHLG